MDVADSTGRGGSRGADASAGTRARRTAAAFAAALAIAVLAPAPTALAEPEDEPSLEELNERAAELEEEYDGELQQYRDARDAAERAEERLSEAEQELESARQGVAQLAAVNYMTSGFDPTLQMTMSDDPDRFLADLAAMDYVSRNNSEQLDSYISLVEEREEARAEADERLADASDLVDDLESQRDEVAEMIERYRAEDAENAASGETAGSGSTDPGAAAGPGYYDVTPRMATVRDAVVSNFSLPYPVGCMRPGDPGEHGSGRACDFMMSSGGAMPSAENTALGDEIAAYLQNNASSLGVMYVIWQQRIWDARNPGAGWRGMEDRGSVTQNHYDHVHVSVF
ncbi:coiled-coil domain-containing protein [Allonocardiopsis opalescens]|uniref:ARB-07466-like C-terminal domain-containing protein n=1 Tax=Allonocardiopsis opalescens TaxID=1144618 RepID=A0A2T0QCI9_9ACTN|nr:hypothetical protein [Allonocardiopsis opalescens]PRY01618.1 hypothetical protein CLV72_101201 [Allonocardiopsis opalescens]